MCDSTSLCRYVAEDDFSNLGSYPEYEINLPTPPYESSSISRNNLPVLRRIVYDNWVEWGSCCPVDTFTAIRARKRDCLDPMNGGTKCTTDQIYQTEVF